MCSATHRKETDMSRNLIVRTVAAVASASTSFVVLMSVVSLADRPVFP